MSSPRHLPFLVALAASLTAGWTVDANAQGRRVPVARQVVVVRPYPYFYSPYFYDPFWYDGQWGVYGPYGYPGYPYRYYNVDPGAAVKLEVKPKQAEVYVDGYYAGIVDDFNGVFQRLRITPGEHEIELYLDGYKAVHQKVYLTPDNTFKLKYDMQKLAAGDQAEPRPQPTSPPPQAAGAPPPPYQPPAQPRGPVGRRPPQPPYAPPNPPPNAPRGSRADASAYGSLSIRVQPGDADITVDGERWRAPDGQERLVIELPEGRHTVEIQKSGYRSYLTDIDVRRGETTPLNVSLRSQEEK